MDAINIRFSDWIGYSPRWMASYSYAWYQDYPFGTDQWFRRKHGRSGCNRSRVHYWTTCEYYTHSEQLNYGRRLDQRAQCSELDRCSRDFWSVVDNVPILFRLGLGLSDALRCLNTKLNDIKAPKVIGLDSGGNGKRLTRYIIPIEGISRGPWRNPVSSECKVGYDFRLEAKINRVNHLVASGLI